MDDFRFCPRCGRRLTSRDLKIGFSGATGKPIIVTQRLCVRVWRLLWLIPIDVGCGEPRYQFNGD